MRLCPRRESPGTGMGRHLKSARQGITKVCQPKQVCLSLASETIFLLRKIALPYPHKCLVWFCGAKRIDRQVFF